MWTSHQHWTLPRRIASLVLLVVSLGLPLVLVLHSVFASRELREMRAIYLRDRAANIAARLELMPEEKLEHGAFDDLLPSEPALLDLRVFGPADTDPGNGAIDAIRSGRELYRAEEFRQGGETVFRAYVPFHSGGSVKIARIDLAGSAPDFILVHARHNVLITAVAGTALLLVSLLAIWSMNRAAQLEQRQLETARLAELGSLAAVLAHEIRNPLGAIKGFAQLARESADARAAKPLDAIVRESKRLEKLVNALLLYGRPLEPVIRPTAWQTVAADLAAYAREAIGDRTVQFTVEGSLGGIETDPDLLEQALLNLVRNSVEAIPAGSRGKVMVRAAATPRGGVLISVEDDGPGLPEKVRARLFAPFVSTKASGTGLGLPISKKLVEALGGSLRFVAVAPTGTRAELEFYGTNSRD